MFEQLTEQGMSGAVGQTALAGINDVPIEDLELSPAIHMALVLQGITTIGRLVELTDKDFTRLAIDLQLDYAEIREARSSLSSYLARASLSGIGAVSDYERELFLDVTDRCFEPIQGMRVPRKLEDP